MAASLSLAAYAQCGPSGNGSDGPYNATSNTTLTGGTYNYTTFNIDPGVVVTVTGTQPLVINCTGNATISGSLIANGQDGAPGVTYTSGGSGGAGVAGGGNGGNGSFSSPTGPLPGTAGTGPGGSGTQGDGWSGGGGAGYTTTGASSGGVGGSGGPSYGTIQISGTDAGSGGGGGSGGYDCGAGGGGGGGGYIAIHAPSITIASTGVISADGGDGGSDGTGNCGAGGGGSGGSIWLTSPTITNNGTLSATGGTGGASAIAGPPYFGTGGNGSDGRIRLDYDQLAGSGTTLPAVGYTTGISPLVSSMSTTNENCAGDSTGTAVVTVMNGQQPYTYMWSHALPNSPTQTGLGAATYTVVITDANGCTSTATGTVSQPSAVTITGTVVNVSCYGSCDGSITTNVSGGSAPYVFSWAPAGPTTSFYNNVCAGCYTITAMDANGCSASQVFCVTQPAPPATGFLGNDTLLCDSATLNLCAVAGYPSYMWSTGATTPCIMINGAGCYVVQMTDSSGCTASDTLCVSYSPCLGISSYTGSEQEFYPNPSSGKITIRHGQSAAVNVQVYDAQGRICISRMIADNTELDLSDLADGVYTLQIDGAQHKLIIAR